MNDKPRMKQVIVMRTDLNMRKGKMAAQAAHASMQFLVTRLHVPSKSLLRPFKFDTGPYGHPNPPDEDRIATVRIRPQERQWLAQDSTKICVGVNSLEELNALYDQAKEQDLPVYKITDKGYTEFHNIPQDTCIAIGPDDEHKIDLITGHLKLL